jgi:undecaprenyl-diphosphatase
MIEALARLDRELLLAMNQGWRSPAADAVMVWITGARHFLVPLALLWLGLLLFGGRRGRLIAAALLVTLLLTDPISVQLLKPLIQRVRPCFAVEGVQALVAQPRSPSFPSSHAANSFGAATVLFAAQRRWGLLGFVIAGVVSFSRVYVGVHYPSDVVGGAVLGAGCGALVWHVLTALERGWRARRAARRAPELERAGDSR